MSIFAVAVFSGLQWTLYHKSARFDTRKSTGRYANWHFKCLIHLKRNFLRYLWCMLTWNVSSVHQLLRLDSKDATVNFSKFCTFQFVWPIEWLTCPGLELTHQLAAAVGIDDKRPCVVIYSRSSGANCVVGLFLSKSNQLLAGFASTLKSKHSIHVGQLRICRLDV